MSDTPKEQLKAADLYCEANHAECCAELLEWHDTGILGPGRIREAAKLLTFVDVSVALSMIERTVSREAMRKCSVEVLRDNDGHEYRVPIKQAAQFRAMLDAISATKYGSREWYDANDALNDTFGQYMLG